MTTKYLWKNDQYLLLLIKKMEAHSQDWLKWKSLEVSSGDIGEIMISYVTDENAKWFIQFGK